jgi:thiosulfate/3-mercaptopyruvate sulfurtransferase
MVALGVGRDDRIVIYDHSPLRSATRAWYMLRHYGADRVAILDGGLARWRSEGRPIETGAAAPRRARFDAAERGAVVTRTMLVNGVGGPILDARSRTRFDGSAADPRPGVAPGHIPGARNLPFGDLYRDDGTLKPNDELAGAFLAAGVDPQSAFVATCGSGVTATSLLFAARRLGGRDARLYDGSWSEWGADPATPKALGPV